MKNQKGFTLIEILISVAILSIIIGLGLFISFDFYKSYSFRSEESTIVSILQKARSQSMNNINQTRHGVHFASPLRYILFECPSGTLCTSYATSFSHLVISSSYNVSINSPVLPFDVIFNQLDGSCIHSTSTPNFVCDPVTQPIVINDNGKLKNITINKEGQIDWQ